MYFPTTRVLTVLELLQSYSQMSGPELAKRLEVDTRTVRRYITMLQDLGIPVEAERGRYGTYRLRPGFKLPPLMFTDDEALSITLGLLAARQLGLMTTAPAIEGALAKIERVLPVVLREQVQAIQSALIFDLSPAANVTPAQHIVITLAGAIRSKQRVLMHYQTYHAEKTERQVEPYGLVYRSGFWYLVGHCCLRQDLRTFRLDRIVQLEAAVEHFEAPVDFDCLAFVVQSLSQTPGTWLVEVILETTLDEARRLVPPALASLEQVVGGVLLRCYTERLAWMARVLINLECDFVVCQPAALNEELQRRAAHITKLAARGSSDPLKLTSRTPG